MQTDCLKKTQSGIAFVCCTKKCVFSAVHLHLSSNQVKKTTCIEDLIIKFR